jgi:coatomer protein complex subunit gamma
MLHAAHDLQNGEIIKRWVNEVQEAAQSRHPMVQFHAVALLHALRATDRLAVSKLVTQLTRAQVKSPLAQCLLVRYVSQVRRSEAHAAVGVSGTKLSTAAAAAARLYPWKQG